MNCYLIERPSKNVDWCEDFAMVVIAKDKLHAERCARCNSSDFRKGELKIKLIDMDKEQSVLTANVGS